MEFNEETIKEAKKQLAILAIKHLKQVDARTLTIFQKHNIFLSLNPNVNFDGILPIIKDSKHSDRIATSAGPLLFYLTKKNPSESCVVKVAELFFATNIELRKTALDYFKYLDDGDIPLLTGKSKNQLKVLGKNLVSTNEQKWRDAAVAIYDSIANDWYCNYAALRQCLERDFFPGVEEFLTKVLRPTISSVDSVTIGVWAASEQEENILQQIDTTIVRNSDVTTALNEYFLKFGHLPLAKQYSIVNLIDKWQLEHKNIEDIWSVLWAWADSFKIPLPRYHVCMYFVSHPDLVPEDKYTDLWHEIMEIIYMLNDEKEDYGWTQSWRMLCEIARHYCCHLESRLPFMDGERIASQAWWLAVQICKLFPSDKENVKQLRNETFLPELDSSSRIWQMASPAIKPSPLRFLTLNTNSIFSLALQAMLGNNLESLNPALMAKEDHKKFDHAITGSILGVYPPKIKEDSEKIYACDYSVVITAKKWLAYIDEDDKNKEMINAFIIGIEKLMASDNFANLIKKFTYSHSGDQILIANYLKSMVYTVEVSLEDIWNVVNDSDWREAAFTKSHPVILEPIFNTLNEIEARYQDKWAYNLPHYYASECEHADERERKQQLFTCVIHSSVCGSSVSAIQRLLKGENKYNYQEDVDHWRKRLEEIYRWAPEWVKARIRPVLAVLHI